MHPNRRLIAPLALFVSATLLAVSCAPPTPPPPENWSVTAHTHTNVVQNEFQDSSLARCPGGNIILVRNCWDEPYIIQIGFRVTYGVPDSATSWIVGTDSEFCNSTDRPYGPNTCPVPESYGRVEFTNVNPIGPAEVLSGSGQLELIGVMTLAWEKDLSWTGGPLSIANQIRGVLETTLNDTVAAGQLPSSIDGLVDDLVATFTSGGLFGPIGALAWQVIQDGITSLGNPDDNMGIALSVFPAITSDLRPLVTSGLDAAGYLGPRTLTFEVPIVGELGVLLNIRPLAPMDFDLDFNASEIGILNNSGVHRYSYTVARE
jgi:hypothetical protein